MANQSCGHRRSITKAFCALPNTSHSLTWYEEAACQCTIATRQLELETWPTQSEMCIWNLELKLWFQIHILFYIHKLKSLFSAKTKWSHTEYEDFTPVAVDVSALTETVIAWSHAFNKSSRGLVWIVKTLSTRVQFEARFNKPLFTNISSCSPTFFCNHSLCK